MKGDGRPLRLALQLHESGAQELMPPLETTRIR